MTKPNEPTLTCSEVVERLRNEAYHRSVIDDPCQVTPGNYTPSRFDCSHAEKILHSWRERRVQELEAERELFLAQLKTALGIADDGRVWLGSGLLERARTLVERESEWREQIRKGEDEQTHETNG